MVIDLLNLPILPQPRNSAIWYMGTYIYIYIYIYIDYIYIYICLIVVIIGGLGI